MRAPGSGTVSAAGKRKGTTGGTVVVSGEDIRLTNARGDASGRNGARLGLPPPQSPPISTRPPLLVTAPWALEFVISPGPFWKLSAPMNPPSTLLPPPVTAPIAELATIVPLLVPAKPPATLALPTVTLPLANDD